MSKFHQYDRQHLTSCSIASALALCLVAVPTTAHAQEQAAAKDASENGEIVVTAQRRTERLSDVPVSVTVLSGANLTASGITDTYSLQQVTPGLRMERLGAYTQPSIRGVTAGATSPGAEANVAIYVDGIYQPNQAANTIDLPDVARIEVSKGPQGTLFGRNATGGAIQIFTREPEYEPSVDMTASFGRFNNYAAKAFITAPLVEDKLAFSVSGSYEDMDGWNDDLFNGGKIGKIESRLIRAKLLFEPSDGVKFVLGGQYSRRSDESLFAYSALNGNTLGPKTAIEPYQVAVNAPSRTETESFNISLRSSFDTDIGTFSTLTAYSKTQLNISADGDASPDQIISFTIDSPDKNFTQELNFASETFGPVSIIAGLFYYQDDASYDPLIGFFPASFTNFSDVKVRAYAAYAEANVEIAPGLVGIAGARYSHEKRSVDYVGGDARGVVDLFYGEHYFEQSWNAFTPRLALRYKIAPRTNIYASYSKGFKSGVYDLNSTAIVPVKPEKIQAWEVGLKTSQSMFTLNIAAFYYDYKDLQVQVNRGGFDGLANAGAARNYGFDVEGTANFSSDFSISGGFAWLHARYRNYEDATILIPNVGGGNTTVTNQDLSGFQVARAPKWTLNLAANYEHEFDFGTIGASANMYHTDDVPLEQSGRIKQDAYTLFNGTISYRPGNSDFKFSVWGKNLSNEKVIQGSFFTGAGDQVSYIPPRTYGVSANYAF